jgi:hypothetical protein
VDVPSLARCTSCTYCSVHTYISIQHHPPFIWCATQGRYASQNLFDFAVKSSLITSFSPSSYAVIAPSPQRDCSTLVAWSRQLSTTPPYLPPYLTSSVSIYVLTRRVTSRLHICLAPHTRFYGFTVLSIAQSLVSSSVPSLYGQTVFYVSPRDLKLLKSGALFFWIVLTVLRSYGLIRLFMTLYGLSIRFYNPRMGYTHRRLAWGY